MNLITNSLLFVVLFILTFFYSYSKKYRSNAIILMFSFLQGFLFSFIYAEFNQTHLLNTIVTIPMFSGVYYILIKMLPMLFIAFKSKKLSVYEDEVLMSWKEQFPFLKDKTFLLRKFEGDNSMNAFVVKVPFSDKFRITFGQKLLERLTTEERIVVVAHEIGHQIKKHVLKRYIGFTILVFIISFIFIYVRDLTLLNFGLDLNLRLLLFFLFAILFYLLVIILFNVISFYIEYDADRQAILRTKDYQSFKSLMEKFDRWRPTKDYGWFINLIIYDHPLLKDRIQRGKDFK